MPFKFGVDSSGNYGYIKAGADTVTPFLTRTGNATSANVLSGKTFSNASSSGLTGTMTNNSSGYATIASNKMGWDSSNHLWCYIPENAYYSTSYRLQLRNSDVASKIGLTAAKIVKGNTILGLAGTGTTDPVLMNNTFVALDYSSVITSQSSGLKSDRTAVLVNVKGKSKVSISSRESGDNIKIVGVFILSTGSISSLVNGTSVSVPSNALYLLMRGSYSNAHLYSISLS